MRRAVTYALAFVLILAACGGGEEKSTTTLVIPEVVEPVTTTTLAIPEVVEPVTTTTNPPTSTQNVISEPRITSIPERFAVPDGFTISFEDLEQVLSEGYIAPGLSKFGFTLDEDMPFTVFAVAPHDATKEELRTLAGIAFDNSMTPVPNPADVLGEEQIFGYLEDLVAEELVESARYERLLESAIEMLVSPLPERMLEALLPGYPGETTLGAGDVLVQVRIRYRESTLTSIAILSVDGLVKFDSFVALAAPQAIYAYYADRAAS